MKNRLICPLAAIPMRKEPSDRSEMTNQILFGETMQLLDENEKWLMVKLDHDEYEGWVDKKQILKDAMPGENNALVQSLFTTVTGANGYQLHLPAGSMLYDLSGQNFKLTSLEYSLDSSDANKSAQSMLESAMLFLGSPYLWGGRTFMGIDCSGFTQIVARLHRHSIPRDAYQQAKIGEAIAFIEESETGDLAFFDNAEGRITHVGFIINNNNAERQIIHASGEVRIDRIDHNGIFRADSGTYSHHLRIIKRLN